MLMNNNHYCLARLPIYICSLQQQQQQHTKSIWKTAIATKIIIYRTE